MTGGTFHLRDDELWGLISNPTVQIHLATCHSCLERVEEFLASAEISSISAPSDPKQEVAPSDHIAGGHL